MDTGEITYHDKWEAGMVFWKWEDNQMVYSNNRLKQANFEKEKETKVLMRTRQKTKKKIVRSEGISDIGLHLRLSHLIIAAKFAYYEGGKYNIEPFCSDEQYDKFERAYKYL